MANSQIKSTAIIRAGYEYQDLVGIEVLIRHYRDPDLYEWVQLESDNSDYRSLDDVVAARKDGSYELIQVKFTVDADQYQLDWDWLLARSKNGTSMFQKWVESLARVADMGPIHSAGLRTNRRPSPDFAKCLQGTRVAIALLPEDIRQSVKDICDGVIEAETFFSIFEFSGSLPDLKRYEDYLRDQLVPTDLDIRGWLVFREYVRGCAIRRNHPEPDGRILRQHVLQLITKRRPQAIRQDFLIPNGYIPPNEDFHQNIIRRIANDPNPITIVWGTPGRGKSTYLSYLTQTLRQEGAAIARHHYFLSAEDFGSNRISFVEIANSLIQQLCERNPEAIRGIGDDIDKLRPAIETAATNLASEGKRLYLIIDGLDHVWRDTQRVDQLNHLFNELLPLPQNVSLLVGTQRVSDEQLPGRLLTLANSDDWIEIPRMDEVAVHRWVVQQDEARPLIFHFDPTSERRSELMEEIATAFFSISQGHPLHLIYAYEELIRTGAPTSAEDVQRLPSCPGGDIRTYYQGLWVRLNPDAKNILQMLAGSDFFWPSLGIRQVLGDFSQIAHLLEPRYVGMVPFHSSVFAWVRERNDHEENYQALLPKIITWLTNDAPEYWQWGWQWLAKAATGDFNDLLSGTTRDWVVDSLMKGWPERQIENIIAKAEEKTFRDCDFPQTVFLRRLKTRVSNVRDYQSEDFAAFRATALAISDNKQQTLNLLDDIQTLTDREVTELARLSPIETKAEVVPICFDELVRRVNVWVELRHRPERDFIENVECLLVINALIDDVESILRTTNFLLRLSRSNLLVSKFISSLGAARNIQGLQALYDRLSDPQWKHQRRLIQDALIRVISFSGGDFRAFIQADIESISAFSGCCLLKRDHIKRIEVHVPPAPTDFCREWYSSDENEVIVTFFYDVFWTALYTVYCGGSNPFSFIYPGLPKEGLGWILEGVTKLEAIARAIMEGRAATTFSAVYTETLALPTVKWNANRRNDYYQYRAFCEALRRISVDLHILGIEVPSGSNISLRELRLARQSNHWSDELWIKLNTSHRIPLLDKEAATALLDEEEKVLTANVTVFNERSAHWTQLASFALLYGDERRLDFLAHAAECLVGYGWRKDLSAMDVLDAVVELSSKDPIVTRERLDKLVPIIESITDFTDGDETNYVRSQLVEVVTKVSPERLPSLYKHHLLNDEYSYADECLIEFAKVMELTSPEGVALAHTFLDERSLEVLGKRADEESAARNLLNEQNTFLGRTQKASDESSEVSEELSEREQEAAKIDPTSFGHNDFTNVVNAASSVHYNQSKGFMAKWLHYWRDNGKGLQSLEAIRTYFETNERTSNAEKILDEAFLVSLSIQGKEAAYLWLVKAHIHGHGWDSFFTSRERILERIALASEHYPERWIQYIFDTSEPEPFYQRLGYSFIIGTNYLVRFLMQVGQVELADKITTSLVDSLIDEVREQPIPEALWFR